MARVCYLIGYFYIIKNFVYCKEPNIFPTVAKAVVINNFKLISNQTSVCYLDTLKNDYVKLLDVKLWTVDQNKTVKIFMLLGGSIEMSACSCRKQRCNQSIIIGNRNGVILGRE